MNIFRMPRWVSSGRTDAEPAHPIEQGEVHADVRHSWPLDLPRIPEAEIVRSDECGLVVGDGAVRRRFFRYAPEFIDDPAEVGLFTRVNAAVYQSPPPFLIGASEAMLVGYRTIITKDRFFNDEELYGPRKNKYLDLLSSTDAFLNEETGLRRSEEGGHFTLERNGRSERRLDGPHIVLCSHEPANYGSFLFRVASKTCSLNHSDLSDLPVIVYAMNDNVVRLLELCGIRRDRIVQHDTNVITKIERVVLPGQRNPYGYLDRESALLFQSLGERFFPGDPYRKLYILRRSHARAGRSTRVLANEEELIERLAAMGFDIVEPETLGMDEQISLFASAKLIVGPSGSAMFNVVFCRPGTKIVDIESEPNWIYAHTGLFASCQLRYGLFVGLADPADERPVHRRWSVDIDALCWRIEYFERA